jgi:guanyl-specific ribonuclease Sa
LKNLAPIAAQARSRQLPPALRFLATAIVAAIVLYGIWQQQQADPHRPYSQSDPAQLDPAPPAHDEPAQDEPPAVRPRTAPTAAVRNTIAGQIIRNESGAVIFRGEIDLAPTLERITNGERLSFPHDGTTFQNRERRLPQKSAGYYREFVHPTAGQRGPGPQRIVTGQQGEIYYTPDHYRTFQRLDQP